MLFCTCHQLQHWRCSFCLRNYSRQCDVGGSQVLKNGYIKAFCQSLIVEVVFAIFKTVFKKWLQRLNQKMPQATWPACPCWFCFLFFRIRLDEIFSILLAFSHLCFISRVRYVFFNIFCVKCVAIRNKSVLKIVSKRAFSNAAKQEAFAFRERAPAATASFLAKCCAFYAC